MPVRSLMELATSACLKNIKELDSVGDYLPYENLRAILLKVDNAHQLRQIELNSPQVDGETGELWLRLIERDFPLEYKAKAYKPQNPKKWYRVWEKYKRDHDQAIEASEKKLKNALAGLQEDKEKNTSKIVERKYLPRAGRTGSKRASALYRRDGTPSSLSFAGGSRTKMANGASVMRKVRREVKEIASIKGLSSRPSRAPRKLGQVQHAPVSMINDYQRATQPAFRPTPKSERPSIVTEHERRASFISDSEEDQDEDDELFDDEFEQPRSKPIARHIERDGNPKHTSISPSKSAPSIRSAQAPVSEKKPPNPLVSKNRRAGGILSNRFKPSVAVKTTEDTTSKAAQKSVSRPPPLDEPQRPSQYLPRTQSSPPLGPSAGPSSPPPLGNGLPSSVDGMRKRKAVDIFMRPKKKGA